MQYYKCQGRDDVLEDIIKFIRRKRNPDSFDDCIQTVKPKPCCQSLASVEPVETIRIRGNICEICEQPSVSYSLNLDYCAITAGKSCHSQWPLFGETIFGIPNSCNHLNNFYSPFSHCELCCMRDNSHHGNLLGQTVTWRTKHYENGECVHCSNDSREEVRKHSCDSSHHEQSSTSEILESFTGLSCRANVSVNFFAVRKEYFSVLAERIGVKETILDTRRDIAVIIDEAVSTK